MEGNPISRRVEAEINDLLKDPKRKVPHAQMKNVHEEIERKGDAMKHVREEVSTLETSLATKDQQLASLAADKEVATLKTALATKDQLLATKDQLLAMLKTALATKDQQLASIKAEKNAAEAKLKSVQDEKEAMETSLNDTRNVKVKHEAGDTTNIYNADTDDDEGGIPEKKKQKTEQA